jgi:methyltransferase
MGGDFIGPPQIAALVVLVQRGLEEIHSQRNTRGLLAAGAREADPDYYPVVAVTHVAWIASVFLRIPPTAEVFWPAAVLFVLVQPVRYWIIASLGRYWTHRIITLDHVPVIRSGPYRFMNHPNYLVTIVEVILLPLAFGDWRLAIVIGAIWIAVIGHKRTLEERAIASRRAVPAGGEA